jgi:hypothetical protein
MPWTPTPADQIPDPQQILDLLERSGTDPASGYITPADLAAAFQAFLSIDYWSQRATRGLIASVWTTPEQTVLSGQGAVFGAVLSLEARVGDVFDLAWSADTLPDAGIPTVLGQVTVNVTQPGGPSSLVPQNANAGYINPQERASVGNVHSFEVNSAGIWTFQLWGRSYSAEATRVGSPHTILRVNQYGVRPVIP